MVRTVTAGAMALTVALALAACSKKSESDAAGANASGSAAAAVAGIGIKECDDYVAKINACFAKDAALKEQSAAGFKAQVDAWRESAARDKDATQSLCKTALATIGIAYPACK